MNLLESTLAILAPTAPFIAVLAAVVIGLFLTRYLLERRLKNKLGAGFRIQLIMLALSLVGLVVVIMALPVSETLRGQVLSLLGILLSASIAMSSTTFLGNAMAGILLRVVGVFGVGDFVRVGDHFGRVSERGLFHTEVQTEDRDLTTLPNSYLVTNPVKVVRRSGTIVAAKVSLGYDNPRGSVEQLLLKAAGKAGLQDPFVQIVDLGDFAVVYRTAGLLTDVKSILSAGSSLRGALMDELHAAGIEIVSPTFMNTRGLDGTPPIVPNGEGASMRRYRQALRTPEAVVFDKAEEATALEELRARQASLEQEVKSSEELLEKAASDTERIELERRLAAAKLEHEKLSQALERAQELEAD